MSPSTVFTLGVLLPSPSDAMSISSALQRPQVFTTIKARPQCVLAGCSQASQPNRQRDAGHWLSPGAGSPTSLSEMRLHAGSTGLCTHLPSRAPGLRTHSLGRLSPNSGDNSLPWHKCLSSKSLSFAHPTTSQVMVFSGFTKHRWE